MRDISLNIGDNEYFVILGPTGSGKTLLLEALMGFYKLDEGRILVDGRDLSGIPPEERGFGYVPQHCMLFPHMTVRDNIEFGLKMKSVTPTQRTDIVKNMLRLFDLEHVADSYPATLSGGEKQKVAIARVLAIKPRAILLDEPLAAIDTETSRDLRHELRRIHQEFKATIIHVTHDQIEGFSLANRIALIREGHIVQVGTPREVLSSPSDESAARFLGYENIFKARRISGETDHLVAVENTVIQISEKPADQESTVAILSEDISIFSSPVNDKGINRLKGTLVDYVDLGPVITATVDVGFRIKATVGKRSFMEMKIDRWSQVYVVFDPTAVKVLR